MSTQPTYQKILVDQGQEIVKRIDADGTISFIPLDLENSDYQAYLIQQAKVI